MPPLVSIATPVSFPDGRVGRSIRLDRQRGSELPWQRVETQSTIGTLLAWKFMIGTGLRVILGQTLAC